jgi:hypothetical protein
MAIIWATKAKLTKKTTDVKGKMVAAAGLAGHGLVPRPKLCQVI